MKIHIKKTFYLSNMDVITGKTYFIDARSGHLSHCVRKDASVQEFKSTTSSTEQLFVGVVTPELAHLTLVREASLQGTWRNSQSQLSKKSSSEE